MPVSPPALFRAAGHPLRWRLLGELARSDRQVHELTALVGQRQSLVSYHLGLLRRADLVHARRSTADGRDTYYLLDLARCADLLAAAGGALHPGLRLTTTPPPAVPAPARVLFLCTGNSSRSQMAEALLRDRSGGAVVVRSAGTEPKPVHPHAVAAMAERGIDLTAARPKHLDELAGERFDHVITLCDRLREVCPELPGHPATAHWSIPAPQQRPAFTRILDELSDRVTFLLHAISSRPEAS